MYVGVTGIPARRPPKDPPPPKGRKRLGGMLVSGRSQSTPHDRLLAFAASPVLFSFDSRQLW